MASTANSTSATRRLFIAAGTAATIFGTLSVAARAEQGLAGLIDAHRKAFAAFTDACRREDEVSDDDQCRLGAIEEASLTALLAHPSVSFAEARSKAAYVLETLDYHAISEDQFDALLRSFL